MPEIKDKPYSMTIQPHKKMIAQPAKKSGPFLYLKNVLLDQKTNDYAAERQGIHKGIAMPEMFLRGE